MPNEIASPRLVCTQYPVDHRLKYGLLRKHLATLIAAGLLVQRPEQGSPPPPPRRAPVVHCESGTELCSRSDEVSVSVCVWPHLRPSFRKPRHRLGGASSKREARAGGRAAGRPDRRLAAVNSPIAAVAVRLAAQRTSKMVRRMTDGRAGERTRGQTDRQTDTKTDRQTDRATERLAVSNRSQQTASTITHR